MVPVSGFYEWARRQGHKQAYLLQSAENPGLLLAGLWDRWQGRDENGQSQQLDSFTILTTAASAGMQQVHHRQPVLLDKDQALWLVGPKYCHRRIGIVFRAPVGNTYDSIAGIILGEQCA